MIEQIKGELRSNLQRLPLFSTWWTNSKFKVERELLKGCHQAKSSHSSIIHFSMNKEDMIAKFPVWLNNLLDYCDLKISLQFKQELLDEAYKSGRTTEDVSKHMCQVTPGDHKRKLQPETITQLNSSFSNILTKFKYA